MADHEVGPRLDGWGRRGGLAVLLVLAVAYPLTADATSHPLAVFVIPVLAASAFSTWRTTALVAVASTTVAVLYGLLGPLGATDLVPRLAIIVLGSAAAVGASLVRELQQLRRDEAEEVVALSGRFQQGLLRSVDAPPGFAVEVRYRPGEDRMQLGGDFYDVVATADGGLAFIVGDVCGHGAAEAALGATLRSAWRPLALLPGLGPVAWLEHLERAFVHGDAPYVTACTGRIDADGRVAELVCAGHPPPVRLGERATLADAPGGRPLGLGGDRPRPAVRLPLDGRAGLLVYTDGITEAPRLEGGRLGAEEVVAWLDGRPSPMEVAGPDLDALLDGRALGPLELVDDVAMVLITQPERARARPGLDGTDPAPGPGDGSDAAPPEPPGPTGPQLRAA